KRKLLIGLIIFLVITNVATIITVWTQVNRSPEKSRVEPSGTVVESTEAVPDNQRTRFFTGELNLDSTQQNAFRNIHWTYMQNARAISLEMSQMRDTLLQSMNQLQPDSAKLNALSEQIGTKHAELKKLTVQYYLGLKAVCNPDQQEKLYGIIRKLINPEGDVQLPSGRRGPQTGRGQGGGPWWRDKKNSSIN
ncbi:MAG: periplasmic heavy metal sensor, partial [Bacteroidales bacterium]|nr:periplasmic heavy metal sensor [Bacteroidales bacterium]